MNINIKFGLFVLLFLILVFIYHKYSITEYLIVVPNSSVSTKLRSKRLYTIYYNLLRFSPSSSINIPSTDTEFTNITNLTAPSLSTITTGISQTDIKLCIYNIGPDTCKIMGINLKAIPNSNNLNTTEKIKITLGALTGTPIDYNGDSFEMDVDKQIQFSNLNVFVLQRLTIICDNVSTTETTTNKSLYVYFKNGSNLNAGIKINNLSNDILIIDLYNNQS